MQNLSAKSRHISWPHIVAALAGIAVSAYAVQVHHIVAAGGQSACGISATVNCDAVIGSKFGVILGLPLGIWGMVYFALMVLTAINDSKISLRKAALIRLGLTTTGFVAVLGLAYISYIVIGVTCPVCMTIHVIITLIFIYSLFETWRICRKSTLEH